MAARHTRRQIMKLVWFIRLLMGGWLATASCVTGWTADNSPPAQSPREPRRERTNSLTPEQREARMRERREKQINAAQGREERKERERWHEQLRNLSPEEREAKIKELRQKYGFGSPQRDASQKWREEWDGLSPEERRARLKQWREQRAAGAPLTAKEREARRQQLRGRLEKQIADLRQKAANEVITVEEKNRLSRLEDLARRFGQSDGTTVRPPVASTSAPAPNQGTNAQK